MADDRCNTDDFIAEIENWPVIWDLRNEDYSNKVAKRNAWEGVIGKFVPGFNELPEAEKKVIGNSFQRKWKSLRDSYTRELAKQKNETSSGSAKKYRKKYIFFEQLSFLNVKTKPTEDSMVSTEPGGDEIVTESNVDEEVLTVEKKRRNSDKLLDLIKKKYVYESAQNQDDDKLFLLSLHKDLASLPDNVKLNVKCQILGVLSFAKQAAFASRYIAPNNIPSYPSTSYPSTSYPSYPQKFQTPDTFNRPPHRAQHQQHHSALVAPVLSPDETPATYNRPPQRPQYQKHHKAPATPVLHSTDNESLSNTSNDDF